MKKFHHFDFKLMSDVHCRGLTHGPVQVYNRLNEPVNLPDLLPSLIKAQGLPSQRQTYLFQEIWEFVPSEKQEWCARSL